MPDRPFDIGQQFPYDLRVPRRVVITGVLAVVAVVAIYLFASSGISYIAPEEVGLLIHNLTGTMEVKSSPGYIFHLPMGMDDLYTVPKSQRTFRMTDTSGGRFPGRENVRLKTKEGADVFVDVEISYRVDPATPEAYLRSMGADRRYWREKEDNILRAVARSVIRDTLGQMTVEEMVNSTVRSAQLAEARRRCNTTLRGYGLEILTISSINIRYTEEYDRLIRDRKEADQAIEKERSAQNKARAEQEKRKAAAQRLKTVAETETRGQQEKRVIEALGRAAEIRARADGEAQRILLDAQREYAVAVEEASAILAEGLNRAAGIRQLAEAYEAGGMALVREALAQKYLGARIHGRPYSLDSHVDRVRVESSDQQPMVKEIIPVISPPAQQEGGAE